jgi:Polyketide cyclase / dehydrase and lipid transport
MTLHRVIVSADVNAHASKIYQVIADYREGHPRILPRPPFGVLNVEQGGSGEGTVICFSIRMMGRTRQMRGLITEPEPGRALVESYPQTGMVTKFTVDPHDDDRGAHVTISTEVETRVGLLGVLQRFLITRCLTPVYARELRNLADVLDVSPAIPRSASPR